MPYSKTIYSRISEEEFEAARSAPGTERIYDTHPVGGLYSYNYLCAGSLCADNSIVEKLTSDSAPAEYFRRTTITSDRPF